MAKSIAKTYSHMRASVPAAVPCAIGRCRAGRPTSEAQKILPHRYPFLMVDRIIGFEGVTKCTGVKLRHDQRAVFPRPLPRPPDHARRAATGSHGPGGQRAAVRMPGNEGKIGYFLSANNVRMAQARAPWRCAGDRNRSAQGQSEASAKPLVAAP